MTIVIMGIMGITVGMIATDMAAPTTVIGITSWKVMREKGTRATAGVRLLATLGTCSTQTTPIIISHPLGIPRH
jgi:hypothetical protein